MRRSQSSFWVSVSRPPVSNARPMLPARERSRAGSMGRALDTGGRLTETQKLDWLRLIRSENVGPRTFRTLLNHYGGARAALAALPELARRGGAQCGPRTCAPEDARRGMAGAHEPRVTLIG